MQLTTKIIAVLLMLLLATPAILFEGCGSGDFCGGCPTDSIAPDGSTVTASAMGTYNIPDGFAGCVSNLTFTFKDSSGNLLNGICVEIFTNGFVAVSELGDCRLNTNYVSYIRTRTNSGGAVVLDFATDVLSCSGTTDETFDYFVQVNSCTAGATESATWTLTCS